MELQNVTLRVLLGALRHECLQQGRQTQPKAALMPDSVAHVWSCHGNRCGSTCDPRCDPTVTLGPPQNHRNNSTTWASGFPGPVSVPQVSTSTCTGEPRLLGGRPRPASSRAKVSIWLKKASYSSGSKMLTAHLTPGICQTPKSLGTETPYPRTETPYPNEQGISLDPLVCRWGN